MPDNNYGAFIERSKAKSRRNRRSKARPKSKKSKKSNHENRRMRFRSSREIIEFRRGSANKGKLTTFRSASDGVFGSDLEPTSSGKQYQLETKDENDELVNVSMHYCTCSLSCTIVFNRKDSGGRLISWVKGRALLLPNVKEIELSVPIYALFFGETN